MHLGPNADLAKTLKGLAGQKQLDILLQALGILTGPGGAAFGHAKAQLVGWTGVFERFLGHLKDFQESLGKQIENLFVPIADAVLNIITPAQLTHFFDSLENGTKLIGEVAADMFNAISPFLQLANAPNLASILDPVYSLFNFIGKFFTMQEIRNAGNVIVLTSTGQEKIQQALNEATNFLKTIGDFVTSPEVQDLGKWSLKTLIDFLKELFVDIKQLAKLFYDIHRRDWGAVLKDAFPPMTTINQAFHSKYGDTPGYGLPGSAMGAMSDYAWQEAHLITLNKVDDSTNILIDSTRNSISTLQQLNVTVNALNKILGTGSIYSPGGGSGGGGGGSWLANTEYGPAVDYVDKYGRVHGTPDSDSSRGIGHIHGVPYKLGPGSAALHPAYAKKLGVEPGGWFKNPRTGQQQQWNDTSGARNKENIDTFKGSQINYSPTYHIQVLDSHGVRRVLENHSNLILKHLEDVKQHKSSASSLA